MTKDDEEKGREKEEKIEYPWQRRLTGTTASTPALAYSNGQTIPVMSDITGTPTQHNAVITSDGPTAKPFWWWWQTIEAG